MRSKFCVERFRIPTSRLFIFLLILFISFSASGWEDQNRFVEIGLFMTGVFLLAIASLGRLWCSLYIAGRKTVSLVTEGPYSLCRNPLYFFSFLGCIGVGLATETFLIVFIMVLAFLVYYPFVIKKEEFRLEEIHGEVFSAYKKRTSAFFPRFADLKEPQEYLVNPVLFRDHIFSALWFVWVLGILEMVESLHEAGFLPVLFKIY